VVWSGVSQRVNIRNTDPTYGGFAGEFIRNTAQMEWTATVGDYTFVSDPLATSSSAFAETGHERNASSSRRGSGRKRDQPRIVRQIHCGVAGPVRLVTPNGASASRIALVTAG
jgi:hypothetical protein